MVAGKQYHWKHGWIPLDHYAELVKEGKKPKLDDKDDPVGKDFRTMTSAQKIRAAEIMHGTNSPQHKAAKKKFGKQDAPAPPPTRPHGTSPDVKHSSGFATAMGMGFGSGDPADDPLKATTQDNPLGLGSIGFSFMPDYKGQKFSEWRRIHGQDFIERRKRYEENQRKGIEPGPESHPVIFPNENDDGLFQAIEKNGGFTYDPRTGGLLEAGKSAGYAVAIPGTEQIVGEEKVNADDINREDFVNGLKKIIKEHQGSLGNGMVLGGWYSPERNQYMVELSQILPPDKRQDAIEVGADRNQESVFDLATGENIFVGGTGDGEHYAENIQALNTLSEELTPEAKAAAKYYSGPGYKPMNAALRAGETPAPEVLAYMRHLDNLIGDSRTTREVTAYRGVQSGPWLPDYLAPGEVWHEKGYMSVAVADAPPSEYTGDTTMVIRVPAGSSAIDMNAYGLSHHSDERELLFAHGTDMRVISDKTMGTQRTIELEIVTRDPV
jgi:hypothetical protein